MTPAPDERIICQIGLEFGAEVIVFDAVDGALELAAVPDRHAAALGPQVEVIVDAL